MKRIILHFFCVIGISEILIRNSSQAEFIYSKGYDRCFGKHQEMLPVRGSCTEFDFCINGTSRRSSCGPEHHFNALKGVCDSPAKAGCVAHTKESVGIDSRICQDEANNGKLFPVPHSHSQYFICFQKQIFFRSCGKFYFDPERAACVSGNSGGEYPIDSNICDGKRNGASYPVPGICSRYYYCENDSAIMKSCGSLHFSPISLSCQEPHVAKCESNNLCLDRKSGDKFEHPNDLQKFVLCSNGQPIEMKCPTGSYFLPILNECFQRNGHVSDEESSENLESCEYLETGKLLRNSLDCGKFFICNDGVAVEMTCPKGLHFNVKKNQCDYPDAAKCNLFD